MRRSHLAAALLTLPLLLTSLLGHAQGSCYEAIAIGNSQQRLLAQCGEPLQRQSKETTVRKKVQVTRGLDSEQEAVAHTERTQFWIYREADGSELRFEVIDGFVIDKQRQAAGH